MYKDDDAEGGAWAVTLEAATDFAGKIDLIPFKALRTGDRLTIETATAIYEMAVINARNARVRLQGGKFRDPLRTHFIGSNMCGGSMLSARNIVLHTFLEFSRGVRLPESAMRILLNGRRILPPDLSIN